MSGMVFLIPIALLMGACGLAAFFWAMRSGQFDDLDGAANRILIDEDDDGADGADGADIANAADAGGGRP
ncbi:cbb3-type cytochrome oxidase assembly protein CcoS [Croceicoccus sp. Ery5]|uniref:cbb3-type cytochrome oxidase assembly protein CcoS n=1 Tax=Croceicoccus sp. Ery5 TaxID=1703340 RepID=UPI001E412DB4|nr:cbb3-type cytochrome oxidase assembly protein CcoS [Croceicoccus sp. Ery5]